MTAVDLLHQMSAQGETAARMGTVFFLALITGSAIAVWLEWRASKDHREHMKARRLAQRRPEGRDAR